MTRAKLGLCALLMLQVAAARTYAVTYSFDLIPGQPGPSYSGLTVDVSATGGTVFFTFKNDLSLRSGTITEIYFEGAECYNGIKYPAFTSYLSSPAISKESSGVDYHIDTTGNLGRPPGSQNLSVPWVNKHTVFVADNDCPVADGIDKGEYLTVSFTLLKSFDDLLRELDSQGTPPRIGLHLQRLPGCPDSQSYILGGRVPVPDGGTSALLLGFGLLFVGVSRKYIAR